MLSVQTHTARVQTVLCETGHVQIMELYLHTLPYLTLQYRDLF